MNLILFVNELDSKGSRVVQYLSKTEVIYGFQEKYETFLTRPITGA